MKAKFRNAGQACIAANRIYVQGGIYDAFAEKVVAAVARLTVGSAQNAPADIGPLINDAAVRSMEAFVADAVGHGATLALGGKRHALGTNFFEPTVLLGMTRKMKASCEEVFGPIAALARFDTEEEAVRLANDTSYGLAGYVFSQDVKRIFRLMAALQTGLVGVNEGAISTEVAPFGGVKESGYGREGSKYGLSDYQDIKYVCLGNLT